MSFQQDFDFSAFLNSPVNADVGLPAAYPDTIGQQEQNDDLIESIMASASAASAEAVSGPDSLAPGKPAMPIAANSWHAGTHWQQSQPGHLAGTSQLDTPSSSEDSALSSDAMRYSSRIAAHHSHLLRGVLPSVPSMAGFPNSVSAASLALSGQRSSGGSVSSASVPLSQSARRAIGPSPALTLQERRRNSRRAQQTRTQQTQGTLPSSSVSGRNAKRGMTTTTGHIHGPPVGSKQQNPPRQPAAMVRQDSSFAATAAPVASDAYSSSGFDLLGALARVMLRPHPRIALGPVDLSCSFTVCDARHPEQPIVYCSDTFCKLTGYNRNEILGRNCRFLQSPDGRVHRGSERFHTDNAAVAHMKQHSQAFQESQASLINYRKNGTPFINLVTIVPIGWGDNPEPVYLVGFQVDLVEQPSAVLERAEDGSYVVNYTSGAAVTLPASTVEQIVPAAARDLDQEAAAREISWARIMLQNSHDLIHVLSLKGTFLYVSPSVERLLGWKPEEMIGKSISDFCHPSDVVPVFRELKDSTSNASINAAAKKSHRVDGNANRATKGGVGQGGPEVNLLMRMRHKTSGHSWIESKGKLHLEQGKGRKVVISSGRPRPVYDLAWAPVKATVDDQRPNFWAKVSSDGLVLSATDGAASVIDGMDHSSLYGRHLTQMVNKQAMPALLEGLRGITVTTVMHQMYNAADEVTWVQSTLFPSAVMPGAHTIPTVFVHVALLTPDEIGAGHPNTAQANDKQKDATFSAAAAAAAGGTATTTSSVFGELATQRSSSHIFELHSLKHVNRRLRDDVRAATKRLGTTAVQPGGRVPAPLKEGFVHALNEQRSYSRGAQQTSSSTPATTSSSGKDTKSGVNSGSNSRGSGSDDTAPTTATSGNNSDSNSSTCNGADKKLS
ncbi:hypothetical protein BDZ90DRAFT_3457 [Jaminaea rosea]|uniref:PAS domain-containing protein n=1 Tax=Jaminaea rosea TaxID=1569628 RepID=A0A316UZ24_9BASI|nr:hypothetical protein BDZ90DRAFT_3457 [Jaminaea rosea]PWN30048.1 hypothetical protein BDZ90DRAFT_3457 [Jaminaea rosea]